MQQHSVGIPGILEPWRPCGAISDCASASGRSSRLADDQFRSVALRVQRVRGGNRALQLQHFEQSRQRPDLVGLLADRHLTESTIPAPGRGHSRDAAARAQRPSRRCV